MLEKEHIRWMNLIRNGMVETHIENRFIDKLKEEHLIVSGNGYFFLSLKGKKAFREYDNS